MNEDEKVFVRNHHRYLALVVENSHARLQKRKTSYPPDRPVALNSNRVGRSLVWVGKAEAALANRCLLALGPETRGSRPLHLSTRPSKRSFGASSPVVALCKTSSRTSSRPIIFSPLCARSGAHRIHHSLHPISRCPEPTIADSWPGGTSVSHVLQNLVGTYIAQSRY